MRVRNVYACLVFAGALLMTCIVPVTSYASESDPPKGKALFRDTFAKSPETPWEWIRENPEAHRVTKNGLEIKLEPGGLMGGGKDAKNILVRPLPAEAMFVSVHVRVEHASQFEQAGLILYRDDDNYIKLVKEWVDGKLNVVFIYEIDAEAKAVRIAPHPPKAVTLALERVPDGIRGWYWDRKTTPVDLGLAEFPIGEPDGEIWPRIGLFTQSGEAGADRWAAFRRFALFPQPRFPKPSSQ